MAYPTVSPAPGWGGGAGEQSGADDGIRVSFAPPAHQNRLTVLFRVLLAIPHLVILEVLGVVAEFAVIIAWFAALVLGRLPEGLAEFLTGWLRWQVRTYAYVLLLTGRYPPFALGEVGYPVRLEARPGRLNRLTVFFRLILAIPAAILAGLAASGALTIVAFMTWLIVLVTGRMPAAVHDAYAAVLRYQARASGYIFLLTDTYPAGLFGDRYDPALQSWAPPGSPPGAAGVTGPAGGAPGGAAPEAPAQDPGGSWATMPGPVAPDAPAMGQPPGPAWGQPPAPGWGQPPGPVAPDAPAMDQPPGPGWGQPPAPGWGAAGTPAWAPPAAATPPPSRLVLPSPAKFLVGVFIALGVLQGVLYFVFIVVIVGSSVNSAVQTADARVQVEQAHSQLLSAMKSFGTKTQACGSSLSCVTAEDSQAARAMGRFGTDLRAISFPSAAAAGVSSLESVTGHAQQAFQQLAAATSPSAYQQAVTASGIQTVLNQFDADYQQVLTTLSR